MKTVDRPRTGRVRAVPAPRAHGAADPQFHPREADGTLLPSDGPGQAQYGYTHCLCGARSPILRSSRERRLWHTMHREQIAGVAWL